MRILNKITGLLYKSVTKTVFWKIEIGAVRGGSHEFFASIQRVDN